MRRTDTYRDRAVAQGYAEMPTDWGLVYVITAMLFMMFVGGVLGTVYFVTRPSVGRTDH